ncbi:MAG: translesion error-prone DNA polymerase V autoproteolytic subunit [Methylotenera sp.]|uniref:LexA family protein n=1 Tax=Methylotenera sp. TaxID=2051956 RepID=UPI0024871022|nr:translesion error-prone DNA polymerase V autoproteolytic subunit [Methylotenera sp.]MDI1308232.1 translesion error-prone DNA polymerase V autoproteolytic subunit [Methylotenera sp.]
MCENQNINNQPSHGGKRAGAGRKKNSSIYGESTTPIRIPNSSLSVVLRHLEDIKRVSKGASQSQLENLFKADTATPIELQIYSGIVSAGMSKFASPAQDYVQQKLDLNKHLITNPPATYLFTVGKSYDSMIDVGIQPGALLIVDRSITPKSSHIVLADIEGELIVKRLYKWRNVIELRSENKDKNYPAITFTEGQELLIWGVVTFNVNSL